MESKLGLNFELVNQARAIRRQCGGRHPAVY